MAVREGRSRSLSDNNSTPQFKPAERKFSGFFIWGFEMAKRAKRVKKEAPKPMGLKVLHDRHVEVTRERDETDRWSGEDTTSSWTVNGLVKTDDYPDLVPCFAVETGDAVYLVYLVYSTGDSFSHSENGCINFVDVFKTREKAEHVAQCIREHNSWYKGMHENWKPMTAEQRKTLGKKYNSEYTIELVREDGSINSESAGWNGYFDHLSYIEVTEFVVDANKRSRF